MEKREKKGGEGMGRKVREGREGISLNVRNALTPLQFSTPASV